MTKPVFHCEIEFYPSPHLNQIYDGFWKLKQKGIINLVSTRIHKKNDNPVIKVVVNKRHILIYDTLDGLNWINGSIKENLEYFKKNSSCDFYFKRSYDPKLQRYLTKGEIHPLGLNFSFDYNGDYPLTITERLKNTLQRKIKKNTFKPIAYEYPPLINPDHKILFLCGLWNPDQVNSTELKLQREQINADRITFVRECKSEFGSQFTGGIQINDYSKKVAKDILAPFEITNKKNFMNTVKSHNICIATKGLHNSIGWKFAEYTTASRAIISEPLHYKLPGNFKNKKNYLSFNNTSGLISNIHSLLNDKHKMQSMMTENYKYYNNYVDSEKLILNTLLKTQEM